MPISNPTSTSTPASAPTASTTLHRPRTSALPTTHYCGRDDGGNEDEPAHPTAYGNPNAATAIATRPHTPTLFVQRTLGVCGGRLTHR